MIVVIFGGDTQRFILASDQPKDTRNLFHIVGEVFTDHHFREWFQTIRTVHFGSGISCNLYQIFMLINDRSRKIFKSQSSLCSHGSSCIFSDSAEQRLRFFAHFRGMGTRSSLQNDLISKNIKALSAFYLTDGDNQWIQRIIHAGNDCLNFCDDISGSQNRIDTLMRGGTMRRNTLDFNSEIVTACHTWTGFKIHIRCIQLSPDMCAVNSIYIVQKTMLDIVLCTVAGFFCSLKNDLYISFQVFFFCQQHTDSAQKHGNMAVMSAGVHDTRILAAKCKPGVFFDRKCIDICTKSDCLAFRGSFASLDHRPETVIIRIIVRSQPHFFK